MEDHVQLLVDKDEIVTVINQLFVRADQRDWEGVKACLAPEVRFDMTSLAGGEPTILTPQQIVDAWEEGLKHLKALHHQIGNTMVTVRSGEADAFCYGTASHYLPNPTGRNIRLFVGSYDFHLIQAEGRWRIDLFKYNLKYIDGNPDLEGRG